MSGTVQLVGKDSGIATLVKVDTSGNLSVVSGLPTGASTAALQTTGNTSLATIVEAIKTEDLAHSSGDKGIMALAVRADTVGELTTTNGDYSCLQVNSTGALRVSAPLYSSDYLAVLSESSVTQNQVKYSSALDLNNITKIIIHGRSTKDNGKINIFISKDPAANFVELNESPIFINGTEITEDTTNKILGGFHFAKTLEVNSR